MELSVWRVRGIARCSSFFSLLIHKKSISLCKKFFDRNYYGLFAQPRRFNLIRLPSYLLCWSFTQCLADWTLWMFFSSSSSKNESESYLIRGNFQSRLKSWQHNRLEIYIATNWRLRVVEWEGFGASIDNSFFIWGWIHFSFCVRQWNSTNQQVSSDRARLPSFCLGCSCLSGEILKFSNFFRRFRSWTCFMYWIITSICFCLFH